MSNTTVDLGGTQAISNVAQGDLMMPGLAWVAPVTDAAVKRAQELLTPRQMIALRQLQAQQTASYRLAPPAAQGATPEDALALYRKNKAPN